MQCDSFRRRALLAGAAMFFSVAAARAGDDEASYAFSGFGTAGVAHADYDQADFAASLLKADGAGGTRSLSAHVDSRLGLQLDVARGKWSGVLQLVSEQGATGSYDPIVEWANVKYQATPDLALRLGRIALPMFLAADYRKVGYAHPWARMPVEMYGTIPLTNSDGVDLHYRWRHGSINHATQAFYGHTRVRYDAKSHATARGLAGFAHSVTAGALTARVSALETEITLDLAHDLFNAFRQFGAQGDDIATRYDVDHKRAGAVSIGANYDPGHWFVTGEFARLHANSYIGDKSSFYVGAGRRVADLTLYATLARIRPDMPTREAGLSTDGMTDAQAAQAAQLNAVLNDMLRYISSQDSVAVGARWDVRDSVAVKLQYDRLRTRDNSYGVLSRIQPGFQSGRAVGVTSLVVDFVF